VAPLATGAHEIEQAVEQAAHVCGPRPPAGLSWRNERFDQAILVIAQSLARSKVADPSAIRGRPHCGLQTGKGSGGTLSTALVARQTNQHTLSKRALSRKRSSEAQGRRREAGSEGSVEQSRDPMDKNRIRGLPGRTSRHVAAKSRAIKGRGGRSGGRAAKAVELTSGDLCRVRHPGLSGSQAP